MNQPKPAAAPAEQAVSSQGRRRRVFRRDAVVVCLLLVPVLLLGGGSLAVTALVVDARAAYIRSIVQTGKEPAFLVTLAFLLTFGTVRLISYSIRDHALPFFHDVKTKRGLHIHHMVPGMLLALVSGYLGLVLTDDRLIRLLAVVFGIGAALVLDEFALILNLADVYWQPAGRESIDAVVLASGVGLLYLLGLDFWPHLFETLLALLRSHL